MTPPSSPAVSAPAADVLTLMLHAVDRKDWHGVRDAFADEIYVDYSSLFDARPGRIEADQQVAAWRAFLEAFDATQHLTGPIVVSFSNGDAAAARTHVRAFHWMKGAPGGDIWVVAGHYDVRLAIVRGAWKITAITLTTFYQDGNLDIPQIARGGWANR